MTKQSIITFLKQYLEAIAMVMVWTFYFLSVHVDWGADWLLGELPSDHIRPLSAVIFPLIFFLNAFYLIPRFLKRKKWWMYLLVITILGALLEGIRSVLFISMNGGAASQLLQEFMGPRQISDPVTYGIVLSCAYVFTKEWISNIGLVERLRAEKVSTELAFLKSQVDPHFLFNTLNTLYAMALEENGHKTADGIAKLGTLMRYNLHDSQVAVIDLSKELAYIQRYIELQRLRLTDKNTVELDLQLDETEIIPDQIAPMILLPFIENAFKYGVSPSKSSSILIQLRKEQSKLILLVENSIVQGPKPETPHGLGIENVKKRLDLLYTNRYELAFGQHGQRWRVDLTIDLNKTTDD